MKGSLTPNKEVAIHRMRTTVLICEPEVNEMTPVTLHKATIMPEPHLLLDKRECSDEINLNYLNRCLNPSSKVEVSQTSGLWFGNKRSQPIENCAADGCCTNVSFLSFLKNDIDYLIKF